MGEISWEDEGGINTQVGYKIMNCQSLNKILIIASEYYL